MATCLTLLSDPRLIHAPPRTGAPMERKGSPVSASERSLAHRGAQVGDSGAHVGAGGDYMCPTSTHWRASGDTSAPVRAHWRSLATHPWAEPVMAYDELNLLWHMMS